MLDFDEDGSLSRLRQDDIELQWETDDAFYRAERRLEDIQALMADAVDAMDVRAHLDLDGARYGGWSLMTVPGTIWREWKMRGLELVAVDAADAPGRGQHERS